MSWSMGDIILGVVILLVVGVAYYLIQDARKKGVHVCGKGCGGCPHPCHSDGTPKTMNEIQGVNAADGNRTLEQVMGTGNSGSTT